jgi:hypothetical protein
MLWKQDTPLRQQATNLVDQLCATPAVETGSSEFPEPAWVYLNFLRMMGPSSWASDMHEFTSSRTGCGGVLGVERNIKKCNLFRTAIFCNRP